MEVSIPEGKGLPLVDLVTHRLPEPTMEVIVEEVAEQLPPPVIPPSPVIPGLYDDRDQTHSIGDVRSTANMTSGAAFITLFRARHTATRSRIAFASGATNGGVTLNKIRVATVDPSDWSIDTELATVNDLTMGNADNTKFIRTLSTPVSFVRESWYAVIALQIASTGGNRLASAAPSFGVMNTYDPPLGGYITGLADMPPLPLSYAAYNITKTSVFIYHEFLD